MTSRPILLCALSAIALGAVGLPSCSGDTETFGGGGQTATTGTTSGTTSGTASGTTTAAGAQTGTPTATGGGAQGGAGQGGNNCGGAGCRPGMDCCGTECVNLNNDIDNCGSCGNQCDGDAPFCDGTTCGAPPCEGTVCSGVTTCCGTECCALDELCCAVPGPVVTGPRCIDPTQSGGTCPMGCYDCVCASPDTPISTPYGEVPMGALRVGDAVYSVHGGELQVVPVARVNRTPVTDHVVVRVEVADGRVLEVSAPHPTAAGQPFGDSAPGGLLDGQRIVRVDIVPYAYSHTFDILPESDSGTYLAAGMLIGTTLAR